MTVLNVVADEPVPEVVEFLEDLLAAAKAGEVRSFVAVTADKGNRVTNCWAGQPNMLMATLGGLRVLERDLMREYIE